jgi:sugar phosphate isomerase/epimerase
VRGVAEAAIGSVARKDRNLMTTPQISVQLYSVYGPSEADLDGTLGKLADIGFRNVEAFDFVRRVDALKAAFDKYGLVSPTAHAILVEEGAATPDGLLTTPPADEVFAAAKALGVDVVIDPYVPPARWADLESVTNSARRLNEAAAKAAEYGLRVGYHNHDHEFTSMIDGKTAYEVFVGLLDPAVVLELDLYWATAGGQDAPALLERLGDRVIAVHVKDGPMRPGITAANLPDDQVPAGQGDVPLAACLGAGSGVKYAVVEFDKYAGDIFEAIAESYSFLSKTLKA